MSRKERTEAHDLLARIGFGGEIGWEMGGFYTPTEALELMERYSVTGRLIPTLRFVDEHIANGSGHETIHCFDVARGAAELVKVLDESGVDPKHYFPHDPETAFIAGVFHDIVLGLRQDSLETAIPRNILERLVTPQHASTFGDVVYLKGPIEDDLLGAAMLEVCNLGDNLALRTAVISAAKDVPLVVPTTNATLLQKVLDGIWYHDGNYPLRGFAEADMIIGQRLSLYQQGKLSDEVMLQGIKKVLGYINIEDGWEERSRTTDIAYLEKILAKKAPGFLDAIRGTRAYDFVVEDLVPRERSMRTMGSTAFLEGIIVSRLTIEELQLNQRLMRIYRQEIEGLAERYTKWN
ncbi:hypothetical protein J4434_03585 [Candidatus Woesearchaeota archaeon]|nr:hypothetical protein [Candidatus Woesearchaeota archaeon]